jgi:gliding motility associated protien GldN
MNSRNFRNILLLLLFVTIKVSIGQPAGQVQLITEPKDKSYDRSHINDLKPIPYTYLRESDVYWEKRVWRSVDFREKMNHPLYFPETPQGNWRSFMQVIWDAMRSGEITAYDASGTSDNFEDMLPVTANQLESTLTTTQQIRQPDPDNPDVFVTTTVQVEFNPQDVKLLWIKEDWIFDKQRSEMQVRIIGVCPVQEDIDPTTNLFRGYKPLFWLYYPEIRPILAKHEVFNSMNSARRLTFDQLFLQRRFSSVIVKEDNVFDRRIDDYASGIDALLESERIKNELRDFEQELWIY